MSYMNKFIVMTMIFQKKYAIFALEGGLKILTKQLVLDKLETVKPKMIVDALDATITLIYIMENALIKSINALNKIKKYVQHA